VNFYLIEHDKTFIHMKLDQDLADDLHGRMLVQQPALLADALCAE
jgi:hypothetical protein